MKKVLETERLILRSFTENDLDDFYDYAKDPNVGPRAGWPTHRSINDSKFVLKMFLETDENYAIVLKSENKLIGSLGVIPFTQFSFPNKKYMEIGYALNTKYQHHGYMHEAVMTVIKYLFEEEHLDLIVAGHFDFNNESRNVIQKAGFKLYNQIDTTWPLIKKTYKTFIYTYTKEMFEEYKYKKTYFETINNRFSVREFTDEQVTDSELNIILNSAQLAPSAVNYQPVKIIVVNDEATLNKMHEASKYIFNAKTVLVICHDSNISWHRKSDNKDHGEIDSTIAATHMMLSCYAIGLGTTYVSSFKDAMVREMLSIPDNYIINCLLPIGYPVLNCTPSEEHLNRQNISEMVYYNKVND